MFLTDYEADPITLDDLPQARSLWSRLWSRLDRPLLSLAALTHERVLKYDALVTSGEDIGLPIALGAMFDALTIPIYIITHGSYFGSRKFKLAASLLKRMRNIHFLCLSGSLCDALAGMGIARECVHNAGYGIDTAFFAPRASDEAPVIASAGTATRDYATLIKASEGLGADVKIAADSTWFPAATDLDGSRIPPHVEARSYGDFLGLRDLYARSRFVVVPLRPAVHACGYAVVAQAMAMAKPVIVSRTASPSDFVVDGETGYYVEPGDVEDLRGKMQELLDNPERARAMGDAARARMEAGFSVEAYSRRIGDIVTA